MRTRMAKGGKPKGSVDKPKMGDKTKGVEKEITAIEWVN